MASVPLHSDHVNYLIFRYLQEHGHEASATVFWRDWNRPREYRDPELLPFARTVKRNDLITVIQDGIRFDELRTQATSNSRRFAWSTIDPRKVDEDNVNGSRPSSSGKRKSIPSHDAPTKRQRMASVPEAQTNGHMEIDARSSSAEDMDDVISPAVASPIADTPTTRYDSVATQTEVMNGQKRPHTTTQPPAIIFKITDKDDVKILHAAWSPSRDPNASATLFVTGNRLCRMYRTPRHLGTPIQSLPHMDEPAVDHETMVNYTSWHPDGDLLTCALDMIHQNGAAPSTSSDRIITIGPKAHGTLAHIPRSDLLQPSIVINMHYSPDGQYLMVIRTNTQRGLIEVWPAPFTRVEGMSDRQPLSWRIFQYHLSDGAWASDNKIVVVSHSATVSILEMPSQLVDRVEFNGVDIAMNNFTESTFTLPGYEQLGEGDADITFQHDNIHNIDIFFVRPYRYSEDGLRDRMLVIDGADRGIGYQRPVQAINLEPSYLMAALQPSKHDYGGPRLLALIHENGQCRLYELDRRDNSVICRQLYDEGSHSLRMHNGSAHALAWSPNGQYLAIVGGDQVHVWDLSNASRGIDDRPVMVWKSHEALLKDMPHMNGNVDISSIPWNLTWDALNEKICCTVANKVVLIECELPEEVHSATLVNGTQPA